MRSGSTISVTDDSMNRVALIFLCEKRKGGKVDMDLEEFRAYVDNLPPDCVEVSDGVTVIEFKMPEHEQSCPYCGSSNLWIDKYRKQTLKGFEDSSTTYIYKRRRYYCPNCKKTFAEEAPFVGRQQQTITNKLRAFRAKKHLSQRQVAEGVGVPFRVYQEYEAAAMESFPPLDVALRISQYLGAEVSELWGTQAMNVPYTKKSK